MCLAIKLTPLPQMQCLPIHNECIMHKQILARISHCYLFVTHYVEQTYPVTYLRIVAT